MNWAGLSPCWPIYCYFSKVSANIMPTSRFYSRTSTNLNFNLIHISKSQIKNRIFEFHRFETLSLSPENFQTLKSQFRWWSFLIVIIPNNFSSYLSPVLSFFCLVPIPVRIFFLFNMLWIPNFDFDPLYEFNGFCDALSRIANAWTSWIVSDCSQFLIAL